MPRTVEDVMREDEAEDYVSYSRRDGKLLIVEILRLRAEVAAKEAEIVRLRTGIQSVLDGNYVSRSGSKLDRCQHGIFYYDMCERCIDEHLSALLGAGAGGME